jgi:DNA-binding transcriptional regulator LsrR (DeoR family)
MLADQSGTPSRLAKSAGGGLTNYERFRGLPSQSTLGVDAEQLRLLTRVARLYHERGMRQNEIAERLSISQVRVSRLLKRATEIGIIRTAVITPPDVHADLEERLEARFGLREVIVVDSDDASDGQHLLTALGNAGASYLESTLMAHERIGVSSWSSTLLALVDSMKPRPTQVADVVVQVQGGLGNASTQSYATRLIDGLARLTGAQPIFLAAPGLVASRAIRNAIVADPTIRSVLDAYEQLTMLIAGVGSLQPSPLIQESGNAIGVVEQDELRKRGAVGDICLHFFDEHGVAIRAKIDQRVVGISESALRAVPRRIAVAGGSRKYLAIRAALRGEWLDVLVTDLAVAERLVSEP